ncbi:MAG: hypothetical protein KGH75_13465 [Rhodospirillales bacterium]|nr:hypothetical protein [Rhodospirillales bacterium]
MAGSLVAGARQKHGVAFSPLVCRHLCGLGVRGGDDRAVAGCCLALTHLCRRR